MLLWKRLWNVSILSYSMRHIDVSDTDGARWRFVPLYKKLVKNWVYYIQI